MHRAHDRDVKVEEGRWIAQQIPGAKYVELPGDAHRLWGRQHRRDRRRDRGAPHRCPVTGRHGPCARDRPLHGIAGSTERAAQLGDARWRELLAAHDATVRRQLEHYRGGELDTAGDGFTAAFDGPARAIRCACAIRDAVRALELQVRAGLHTGECELVHGKVGGIAVHIGARICVTRPARRRARLEHREGPCRRLGDHLRRSWRAATEGIPDAWRLFNVAATSRA
jgi:hypothetical protein